MCVRRENQSPRKRLTVNMDEQRPGRSCRSAVARRSAVNRRVDDYVGGARPL